VATTQDWSAITAVPAATRYFAGGDASNWCLHTLPSWCRVATIVNRGTGALYVSAGPALTGAAATTDHATQIPAGSGRSFPLSAQGEAPTPPQLSIWGADGAAHAMDLTFERVI
jgi:hypothetical protein